MERKRKDFLSVWSIASVLPRFYPLLFSVSHSRSVAIERFETQQDPIVEEEILSRNLQCLHRRICCALFSSAGKKTTKNGTERNHLGQGGAYMCLVVS